MKQFFISLLASILGFVVAATLMILIAVGILGALVNSVTEEKPYETAKNSILLIELNGVVKERSPKNPFENILNDEEKPLGLNDILNCIQRAKTDNNIKGVFLDLCHVSAGMATVEEIRNALLDFKQSGKYIISYSEGYSQKAYYLASIADKVYLNPQGDLDWKGLSAQVMFFKHLLEKLDIDVQIFRHGKFKSAVEPFAFDKMSKENREQTMKYVSAMWNHIVEGISKQRNIDKAELNRMADNLLIQNAGDALQHKLVDQLMYKDELLSLLRRKNGLAADAKISTVKLSAYRKAGNNEKFPKSKNKIAIVYAVGAIEGGEGDDDNIGSERISKAIREARLDNTIKAIVLRVNSPGGSALASEVIWREVNLAQKVKPVVVSMGDVAASGGYYIACAANLIVAEPNTITGSIGVLGLIPNMQKLFNNKLGITFDTVNSNKHADMGSVNRPLKPEEREVIQKSVETVYSVFLSRVAEGRHKTIAEIDSIGQGRVWSGSDAIKIGLVDELGGIDRAITLAAEKAKLKEYKIQHLPKLKEPFEQLLKEVSGNTESRLIQKELGEQYRIYQYIRQMSNLKGIQARLPYDIFIY